MPVLKYSASIEFKAPTYLEKWLPFPTLGLASTSLLSTKALFGVMPSHPPAVLLPPSISVESEKYWSCVSTPAGFGGLFPDT